MDNSLFYPIVAALVGVIYTRLTAATRDVKREHDAYVKETDKDLHDHNERIQRLELVNQHKFETLEARIISLEKSVEELSKTLHDFIHQERNIYSQMRDVLIQVHENMKSKQ